ncbi:LacI family DNA-binding transcriptional regulator [Trinickia diaoshuihuensis]|uniref:LacI family DNA-binding transcriptional regulator n=1 Tax=Trinickia diaoshuihuensis TaxID=2292265 RepID=UPI000E25C769|nr:LacI family DNA-binding transcriptional regulator [Trinickia diaoshuihuensis]
MKEKPQKHWVTSSDVALRAGVSRSAVSRAFSPTASIAPETRERVMKAAQALGYQVNMIAREMNMQRSSMVGVVTAGFENPFRAKLLSHIITSLSGHALTPLVLNAEDPRQIQHSLEVLLSYRIAGMIMTSASPPVALARQYLKSRIPVTMINRAANLPGADVVLSDNVSGASNAVRMLTGAGAQQLIFVGPAKTSYSARARGAAFGRAIKRSRSGDAVFMGVHVSASDDYESGVAAAHAIFAAAPRPDGVFCSSDLLALGLIDTARHRYGLQVPGDVFVVGFDDIPASSYANYQLTTIRQDTQALANTAVDLLVDRIGTFPGDSRTRIVPVEAVVRKSCA